MDRREFFRRGIGMGVLAGAAGMLGDYDKLFAATRLIAPSPYDLVAVKGGRPDVMFDKAIASLGGMKKFVKKGQTVLVKPNIGWMFRPKEQEIPNPMLVSKLLNIAMPLELRKYLFLTIPAITG